MFLTHLPQSEAGGAGVVLQHDDAVLLEGAQCRSHTGRRNIVPAREGRSPKPVCRGLRGGVGGDVRVTLGVCEANCSTVTQVVGDGELGAKGWQASGRGIVAFRIPDKYIYA